jgi:hypothetical protein
MNPYHLILYWLKPVEFTGRELSGNKLLSQWNFALHVFIGYFVCFEKVKCLRKRRNMENPNQ